MLRTPQTALTVFALCAAPLAVGCAGRTAPFNELDQAQGTIMRLQQEAPPAAAPMAFPQIPGLPGIPPEVQAMGQQAIAGIQAVLPPGLIPPGLIPGMGPAQPSAQQLPKFKNFAVLASMPIANDDDREEILDIFGHESNFQAEHGACFTPGMGVSLARPNKAPVDLLISIQCNQVQADGFKWPYDANGFTPETRVRLTRIFEKNWGPVPQTGG